MMPSVKKWTAVSSAAVIACGLVLTSGVAHADAATPDPSGGSGFPPVTVIDGQSAGNHLRQATNDPGLLIAVDNVTDLTSTSSASGVEF